MSFILHTESVGNLDVQTREGVIVFTCMRGAVIPYLFCTGFPTTSVFRRGIQLHASKFKHNINKAETWGRAGGKEM